MAYTCGANTTDDYTATSANGMGGTGSVSFTAGWWYPTTLTATRGYLAAAANVILRVATATDELNWKTSNATTNGEFDTTGADITVDKWWFVAMLNTQLNAGPASACRIWVGDIDTRPPAEVTVTQTVAPVGNFTGNSAKIAGAGAASGSVSFQGDVGWVTWIGTNTVGINSPLGVGTAGAIANSEADIVYQRLVLPLYLGRPALMYSHNFAYAANYCVLHMPMRSNVYYEYSHDQAVSQIREATINGDVISSRVPPTSPPENWPLLGRWVRRAA